jgi:uncharacterized protein with PQ loop repeat
MHAVAPKRSQIQAFAPQIIKILRTKTSFGVSALNVLFGMAGNGVAVVNALITYFSDLECCWASSISFVQCIELNLPLIQLWLPFMMSVILVISFAYYCDPVEPEFPAHTALRIKHFTWAALGLSMLVVLICVLVPFSLFYETTTAISVLYSYRDAAGYVAAALASVQFLPQIAQTLQLRRPGRFLRIRLSRTNISLLNFVIFIFDNQLEYYFAIGYVNRQLCGTMNVKGSWGAYLVVRFFFR